MEHTLSNLVTFSSKNFEDPKHQKIQAFHFDLSGHVVTTNSHVLIASKRPYEIRRAGKTYSTKEFGQGHFNEALIEFPNWKIIVPNESSRKITIKIPKWFEALKNYDDGATMILNYKNVERPYFMIADSCDNTSLGFNAKYLAFLAGEEISMLISGPTSPTIILDKCSQIDPHSKNLKEDILNENWFYVLMPIRLVEEINQEIYI